MASFIERIFTSRLGRIERKLDRLERFSEGLRATYVGNNRVLVKTIVGDDALHLLVEADDLLLSPHFIATGQYEPKLTDYFRKAIQAESHCLDIGSNFGFFTCLFCLKAARGKVIGVEADRHMYELGRDNLSINGFLLRLGTIVHAAVSDRTDEVTLYRRGRRSGNTSICDVSREDTDFLGEPPAEPFTVQGIRIDDLLDRFDGRLDFIKIDVEGAEPLVMRGAQRTIETNPQVNIVMEWSPGQLRGAGFDPAEFVRDMARQGLTFHDVRKPRPRRMTADELLGSEYMTGVLMKR